MRSFIIFAILFSLLTACSPQQVTAIPTATATLPPPTATVTPAPTISPAFLDLQTQIAANTQNYTIMGNGGIQGTLPDGTIGVIPGITLNPDGETYTLIVEGEPPVTIDASDVTITDEGGVQVAGYQNADGDEDYEKVVTYTAQTWATMDQAARDKVKDALPQTMTYTDEATQGSAELTRGGFSSVKDNLVRYENAQHEVVRVFNALSGEYGDPLDNGIIDLAMNDGTFWEMPGFHTGTEALNYAGGIDGAKGTTMDMQTNPDRKTVEPKLYRIVGWLQQPMGRNVSDETGHSFGVMIFGLEQGKLILYTSGDNHLQTVFTETY
ncbi:MAG: hypothetical protein HY864_14435 [Chloroflexi bacterium]|nr:hypothetical protein [Chloroflexota bacterium]